MRKCTGSGSTKASYMGVEKYPTYYILFNNCLHFVKKILRGGSIDNDLIEYYVKYSVTPIPNVFYRGLVAANKSKPRWYDWLRITVLITTLK